MGERIQKLKEKALEVADIVIHKVVKTSHSF